MQEGRTRRNSCRMVLRIWTVSRRSKDIHHRRELIPETSSLQHEEETLVLDLNRLEDSSAGSDAIVGVMADSM